MLGKGNRMMMVRLDRGQDGCTVPLYTSPPAQPAQTLNLDTALGFTFSVEGGTFIGDVQMLKWLVEHHSREYWAHMAKRNEEGAR